MSKELGVPNGKNKDYRMIIYKEDNRDYIMFINSGEHNLRKALLSFRNAIDETLQELDDLEGAD